MLYDIKSILNTVLYDISLNSAYCEEPSKNFTRKRKLPMDALMRLILNMEGNFLNSEIYNNFPDRSKRMTASTFVQQRNKLKPDAFKALLHEFNATMTDVKTMKGLRVYAIDGSDFCTP